uniref:Conserved plasma membrane protein n=1 Tax=Anisakis simplex TaxID=6269 RepID=A0A0M3KED4_ANISI
LVSFSGKSGCKRQRSGSVRCWCYGQSNCNNPENSRKLYKAFAKGDPDELERVIEEIETSDVSDYNYNEPLLKINEPIDMDDDSSEVVAESKERSHSRTHDRHRSSAEVKKSAGNEERPSEHQVKISPTKLFEHPKKVEEHHHHHRDSKEAHNSDRHDTVKSLKPVTHRPIETEQKPEPRARLGFMYERPDDSDSDALSEDQADSSESLYTESVAVIRTLPTDKTSKASKKTKSTRTQHTEQEEAMEKEEERKPFEAVELPSERQKDYLENDHRMRSSAANSLLGTNIFASFLVISLCWFFA